MLQSCSSIWRISRKKSSDTTLKFRYCGGYLKLVALHNNSPHYKLKARIFITLSKWNALSLCDWAVFLVLLVLSRFYAGNILKRTILSYQSIQFIYRIHHDIRSFLRLISTVYKNALRFGSNFLKYLSPLKKSVLMVFPDFISTAFRCMPS